MKHLLGLSLLLLQIEAFAHTWNEPWHEEVVSKASTFALYEVVGNTGDRLTLKLVKHLSGEKTGSEINVNGFYLYDLMSTSTVVDEHPFGFKTGQKVYFHLYSNGENYSVATPTAGADEVLKDGTVAATFRHSLHKAKVNTELYENLQNCIFKALHGNTCSRKLIKSAVLQPLTEKVAVLSENANQSEIEQFFRQHAALETAYLSSLSIPREKLTPFLNSDFFHVQVSAIRALYVSDDQDKVKRLVDFITSDHGTDIAKVMAVILISNLDSNYPYSPLRHYLKKAPEDEVSLGGNIMDPRVGTWFPESVKEAIKWYLHEKRALNKSSKSTPKDGAI